MMHRITLFHLRSVMIAALLCCPTPAFAFYGEDYLKMRNGPSFTGKSIFSFLSYTYGAHDQGSDSFDYWEIRPGLGYAFTDWVYLGMDCVLGSYGRSFLSSSKKSKYPAGTSLILESVQFNLVFGVGSSEKVPIDLGIDIFYRCPTERSRDMIRKEHAGGFTVIISETYGKGHSSTINFSYWRDGEKDVFQWGMGSAFQVGQTGGAAFKIGIESIGDFSGHSSMIPGVSAVIGQSFSVKAGVGVGFSQYTREHKNDGDKEDDLTVDFEIVKKW